MRSCLLGVHQAERSRMPTVVPRSAAPRWFVVQVRFDSSRRRSSRILFLTEGLLLRQIASDPDLSAYSVVIVDEVVHFSWQFDVMHRMKWRRFWLNAEDDELVVGDGCVYRQRRLHENVGVLWWSFGGASGAVARYPRREAHRRYFCPFEITQIYFCPFEINQLLYNTSRWQQFCSCRHIALESCCTGRHQLGKT